ncbi:MAG: mitogen-activated protein kinase kinase kinase [archaeon]|nr:mitogen-activated protein kinase kinase kinase [archaeon]
MGEGSYGKVYQAFNEKYGQMVAIKEIDVEKLSKKSKNIADSLEIEIELLSKLNHKSIIKYYGAYVKDTKLNIVLEYCVAGSLLKMLHLYHNFTEKLIRKYTTQILEGIEYLHSHNVIHRDIKCANILLDRDGYCKLTDFGLAKIIKADLIKEKNSFEGTPNWMAPEVVKSKETTRFSDIWSIGCTVIEMIQGKPPWGQFSNIIEVFTKILNAKEPPEIPKGISKELKDFLEKCLQIDPLKRWNVCQLLKHPFIQKDYEPPIQITKRKSIDNSPIAVNSNIIDNENKDINLNVNKSPKKTESPPKTPPKEDSLKENEINSNEFEIGTSPLPTKSIKLGSDEYINDVYRRSGSSKKPLESDKYTSCLSEDMGKAIGDSSDKKESQKSSYEELNASNSENKSGGNEEGPLSPIDEKINLEGDISNEESKNETINVINNALQDKDKA